MKIDSSKLPAWQPGRAPAGRGDPAAPGAPARAPRSGSGAGRGLRALVESGRGSGPRLSRSVFFLERKDLMLGHLPHFLNKFPTSPERCPLLQTRSSRARCKHAKGEHHRSEGWQGAYRGEDSV